MTNKERWTVYPLLFLTLGIALRDKFTGSLELPSITCEELVLAARGGQPRLKCSLGNRSARIEILGAGGKSAVTLGTNDDGKSGRITVFSAKGEPQVVARSIDNQGAVETLAAGKPQVLLGSNKQGGIVTTLRDGKLAVILGAMDEGEANSVAVNARDGKPRVILQATGKEGIVETRSATDAQVLLHASSKGGLVSTFGNQSRLTVSVGHEALATGVFAHDAKTGQTWSVPLITPLPAIRKPPAPKTPEPNKAPAEENAPPPKETDSPAAQ
jgi:hypothetical protein